MGKAVSDARPKRSVSKVYPALAIVLVGAAFLRFWEVPSGTFHFMGDEGTQSGAEWHLIHGPLPLLGPSLSIGPMHLGPAFYYLMALPLWITGGSPVGPTIAVGLFGAGAVALLFFYLRRPLGDWPALGACAVMAASFLMVEYSRRPWNPTPTPFFTLLFLWSLVLWKRRSPRWLIVVSACLAILLQLQPVNAFLALLLIVFIVLARPPMPPLPVLALSILVFLVIFSPLIIYDATHDVVNTRTWLEVVLGGKGTASPRHASSPRLLFNLFNRAFELRVVAISIVTTVVVGLAAIYVALIDHDAEGANWEVLLPLILLVIAAAGFEIYRKEVFEQYLVCLFIVPFVFVAALLRLLWKVEQLRFVAAAFVLGLVVVGVRDVWTYSFVHPQVTVADAAVTSHDLQADDTYSHVVRVSHAIVKWSKGKPFSLYMTSSFNHPEAYKYVLAREGHAPSNAALTYFLVEPPNLPPATWQLAWMRNLPRQATRSRTIGIVKLYQIGKP
jgi:4-amino-4-deoxy-L-arabinose transferase-like glycosyltransferase